MLKGCMQVWTDRKTRGVTLIIINDNRSEDDGQINSDLTMAFNPWSLTRLDGHPTPWVFFFIDYERLLLNWFALLSTLYFDLLPNHWTITSDFLDVWLGIFPVLLLSGRLFEVVEQVFPLERTSRFFVGLVGATLVGWDAGVLQFKEMYFKKILVGQNI